MEEYRLIGERLEKELLDVGKEKHYRDLIELIDRIADYIFKESPRVKKGIGEIMGGQVLELESERLERLIREGCEAARVDFTGFKGTKNTVPAAIALSAKTVLSVRLQGFEPWTP